MATLTGKLVSETYKALLKMIDNDILTESEKQISDGYGQGTGIFIDDNGFIRASVFKVTGGSSSQFLKADGSLDGNSYLTAASASALFLPIGSTTTVIPEGTNLYFTNARVLSTTLTGFVSTEGTVTAADTVLTAIDKIWWNIENGGGGGGGYVPYTGATQNLNLGTYGLISDYIQFNLSPTSIPTTAGTMSWNNTDGTVDLKLKGGNVTLQLGQEQVVRVVNKTGANLTEAAYKVVRVRNESEGGAQGQRLAVLLAQADSKVNHTGILGIVTENITNNQEGFVTSFGEVRNIDTTGDLQDETWADGDALWLSETVAGQLTNIEPETHPVQIGYVLYAHQNNGKIYVYLSDGVDELTELHDVEITDAEDEDVLFYDATESLWINKNIYSAINATDVGKSLLSILNAEDTTPVTTKPRGIRINVDNTVDALEVGTQGYLPFYDDTDFYIDSPVFTDGDQVFIGGDDSYLSVNSKLTVVGGNLTVDDNWGIHLGLYQILFRYDVTGELRFGTGVPNDFTTFYANAIERMRLNASGYLGIGLTNPSQPLHVKGVLAYPKIIIDNNSASGGGMFSAYQNGTETAMFGVSGAWLLNNTSDAAIVATRAGQGIQFFTNGSNSEKMGINSDGNVFVGQTPTYVAGATQLIVRGKTGAGFLGVNHYDMSIKGSINTFNSVFQVGTSTFHSVAFIVEDIERARINSGGRMLLGTTTDNTVDKLQIDGSLIATAIKKTGGTSTQYLMADGSVSTLASYVPTSRTLTINGTAYDLTADRSWSVGTVTSVSASVPTGFAISGSPITSSGTLAITFASGYALPTTIKQSNWDDAYTFVAAFPTQTGNAGKYLTTDGSSLSWGTVTAGVSSFNTRTGAVTLSSTDVTTALGYTPVTQARTLTINGTTYDLSADRAWTVSAGSSARNVSTFTATAGQTTFTITGGYTPNLVDVFLNGVRLTGVDFTATNGTTVVLTTGVRVNDIIDVVNYTDSATSGITGSGTSGYLPKWTGTSVVSNSQIFDNGTNVGIGTASPTVKLDVVGAGKFSGALSATSATFSGAVTIGNDITYGLTIGRYSAGIPISYIKASTSSTGGFRLTNHNGSDVIVVNGSNNLTLDSPITNITGNVGIGTTSPSAKLHISGSSSGADLLFLNTSGANTNYAFKITGAASDYLTIRRNHPSGGNLDIISFTYGGNVGIGTSSPTRLLDVSAVGTAYIRASDTANSVNVDLLAASSGGWVGTQSNHSFQLQTANTERIRITNGGNVLINSTADNGVRFEVTSSGQTNQRLNTSGVAWALINDHKNAGTQFFTDFRYNGSQIGTILGNNTSVSFNTSSDYRLKEDFQEINGIELLSKINFYNFKWKSENSRMDGVIAHELQEILPYAVTGLKDGKDMQAVDYSKLTPVIGRAVQELDYKFETQAEKIARLEKRVQQLEAK
jgi:hypothetical protein